MSKIDDISVNEFLNLLQTGSLRAAYRNENNQWLPNEKVKKRILAIFNDLNSVDMGEKLPHYRGYYDKDMLQPFVPSKEQNVRLVPGGTSVRPGVYLGKNTVIMPPSFINIGAYVGARSMIDSNVLIGSCAQIGEEVHVSAGVQIGGVLEPISSLPVVVEDNCFIGAGALLLEGVCIKKGAVICPGVRLSMSIPVYDAVHNDIYYGEVPADAVVAPGSRQYHNNHWLTQQGVNLSCAVIVKYRDDKTSAATTMEQSLRQDES